MDTTSSAARFEELTRPQRRTVALKSAGRSIVLITVVIAVYFLWPVQPQSAAIGEVIRGVLAGIAFLAILAWQLRRIVRADLPQIRALETLVVITALFVVLVAGFYVELSASDPEAFTQNIDKMAGLYFATTVLSTVGFGDISPVTSGARAAVTLQMVLDLVILAALARILVAAARTGLRRGAAAAHD